MTTAAPARNRRVMTRRRTHRFTEALSVEQLLHGVPMRNKAVLERRTAEGVVLELPIRRRWWNGPPLSWLFPLRGRRRFALDTLGREVWEDVDNTRSVETLVEGFADRHHLSFQEARLMVAAFLKMLVERSLIVLTVDADNADEEEDHDTNNQPGGDT